MFTLYRIAFPPSQKPYRIGLLLRSRRKDDFCTISVTERSCAALISKMESHIYRIGLHTIADGVSEMAHRLVGFDQRVFKIKGFNS